MDNSLRSDRICNFYWPLFLVCVLSPLSSLSQLKDMDIQTQRLWLKLASTDLNVTARNAIDIDRGILLASNRMDINSMVLISENFDDIIQSEEYGRVVKES